MSEIKSDEVGSVAGLGGNDGSYLYQRNKINFLRGDTQGAELKYLRVYYQNVCSLLNKVNQFEVNMLSLTSLYDVFVLTETWLDQDRFSGEYFDLDSTQVVRADRRDLQRSTGGGCLIAVGKEFTIQTVEIPQQFLHSFVDIDIIALRIKLKTYWLNIVVLYIPPKYNTNYNMYSLVFDGLAGILEELTGETILLGDFNVPQFYNHSIAVCVDKLAEMVHDFAAYIGLSQFNSILNDKNRLLDLVFCSLHCEVTQAMEPLVKPGMYHPPLDVCIQYYVTSLNHSNKGVGQVHPELGWFFDEGLFPQLKYNLTFTNWNPILLSVTSDEAVNIFNYILEVEFVNIFQPKRPKGCQKKYPVWMSKEAIDCISRKNHCKTLFNKTGTNLFRLEFRALSNKARELV